MNTRFEYVYTDNSPERNTQYNVAILSGGITPAQEALIRKSCENGLFIPAQVGLPEHRFEDGPDQRDHVWFSILPGSFMKTDCRPTVDMTVQKLCDKFAASADKWDEGTSRLMDDYLFMLSVPVWQE